MKKKRSLLLLVLALILLLGGAYVLYGQLSAGNAPDQLQSLTEGPSQKPAESPAAAPSPDVAEETPAPSQAAAAEETATPSPDVAEETPAPSQAAAAEETATPSPDAAEETPAPSPDVTEKPPTPSPEVAEETADPDLVQAPDFTAYDLDGNAANLSDYFGKPLVLNFWASWCGPCQGEMPDFHAAWEELGGEVQFLMVNMTGGRETLESASTFIEEQGYTFPVLYDTDGAAAAAYSVYSLPTTYFIDADGNAIARATGAIDADTLQTGIDLIWTD